MTWLMAVILAVLAFALAVVLFKVSKALWTSLAAALAFGLVGYAIQANPDLPSAPKAAATSEGLADFDIVSARQEFIGIDDRSNAPLLVTADAMARRGRFIDASQYLSGITSDNPRDFEAWVAQGNALVEHAGGALTAPALYSYRQAAELKPEHIAPSYFLGVSLIRQGRLMEARQIWSDALAAAPEDADGREGLEERLMRLDTMLNAMGAMQAPAVDPVESAPEVETVAE